MIDLVEEDDNIELSHLENNYHQMNQVNNDDAPLIENNNQEDLMIIQPSDTINENIKSISKNILDYQNKLMEIQIQMDHLESEREKYNLLLTHAKSDLNEVFFIKEKNLIFHYFFPF